MAVDVTEPNGIHGRYSSLGGFIGSPRARVINRGGRIMASAQCLAVNLMIDIGSFNHVRDYFG
jgi:hypothetical protein